MLSNRKYFWKKETVEEQRKKQIDGITNQSERLESLKNSRIYLNQI